MSADLLTPEALAQMETLSLRARSLVESVLTGTHRGNQRGFSVDFAEHRDYSPGDDVRFLDWKLYGKRDRFYVRQFEDENQLQAWLLLDVSGSMRYGSQSAPLNKLNYAACLAAAIGWMTCYQRDKAALLCFDDSIESIIGPLYGTAGTQTLINQLEALLQLHQAEKTKSIEDENWTGLSKAAERVPEKSIVILLTDAFGDLTSFRRGLRLLQLKKCDVRLLHVLDTAEKTFPFEGSVLFRDLEGSGDQQIQAQAIRTGYLEEFNQFLHDLKKTTGETNCRYHQVDTSSPAETTLRSILQSGRKA
ncbi:DUF58 domain-containing protein [Thalassoglobus sp.]|uniref:DUF58 domain-containing protein n=1 Tax=Thalassoglobus sp. TaxID=2795869 RepID=UPI003AA7E4B1